MHTPHTHHQPSPACSSRTCKQVASRLTQTLRRAPRRACGWRPRSAPPATPWVPYKQINGLAIYYHEKCVKLERVAGSWGARSSLPWPTSHKLGLPLQQPPDPCAAALDATGFLCSRVLLHHRTLQCGGGRVHGPGRRVHGVCGGARPAGRGARTCTSSCWECAQVSQQHSGSPASFRRKGRWNPFNLVCV